jgi:hypothetical protein
MTPLQISYYGKTPTGFKIGSTHDAKRGNLTAYEFSCGYVEQSGVNCDVSIWKESGCSHYSVRRSGLEDGRARVWEGRPTLKAARAFARSIN